MKKNKIVKMVMSAAVAAYVAVMPVQAEETEEEIIIKEWGDAYTGPQPQEGLETLNEYAADANGLNGNNTAQEENSSKESQTEEPAQFQGEESQAPADGGIQETESKAGRRPGPGRPCLRDGDNRQGDEGDQASCQLQHPSASLGAGEVSEAEYTAMGAVSGEEIEEASAEKAEMEELIKRTGYGPHLLLYKKEEEEKQEAKTEPEPPAYSEEDLYILAHAICGEGQGYPDDEQLYIGSVILNRRSHRAFPNTIKEVVFQRGQYACTRDGNYDREPTEANWRNARWLLENGSILPGNVVYQAGFRQGSGLYVQTRYHKYCYR